MRTLEKVLNDHSQWIPEATLEQANTMFDQAISHLQIPATTPKARKRRIDQLSWATLVRRLIPQEARPATRARIHN